MTIHIDDKLAEDALLAGSAQGSIDLVKGLIDAGVRASSTHGAALMLAEYNGHMEIANLLRHQIHKENVDIPDWRNP